MHYDIIGDVHGCASQLEQRLIGLGYRRSGGAGAYHHRTHRAVFVGDLIDRGPQQRETLELVKAMVDGGSAQVVMGNHEFNAVAYATEHPNYPGAYLRSHSEKHSRQHQAFLDQLTVSQQQYYVRWFKTLPLWLDLGELRVVHACWHEGSMRVVEKYCGGADHNRLTTIEQLVLAADKHSKSDLYDAVEVLLKGPEINLEHYSGLPHYRDKDGNLRNTPRICWWREGAMELSKVTELHRYKTADGRDYPPLNSDELRSEDRSYVYNSNVPVFYGHYWREGSPKHINDYTRHTACVDFSAVELDGGGGTLVAYRWSGESEIDKENYVPHGSAHPVMD